MPEVVTTLGRSIYRRDENQRCCLQYSTRAEDENVDCLARLMKYNSDTVDVSDRDEEQLLRKKPIRRTDTTPVRSNMYGDDDSSSVATAGRRSLKKSL